MLRLDTILVARDFSLCSNAALSYALDLAHRTGAHLHTLYVEVLHGDPHAAAIVPNAQLLARLRDLDGVHVPFDPHDVPMTHAVERNVSAAPAILDYAKEHGADLVVTGTHGWRGLRHFLLGSVAEEVVRRAPCPVLTVHAGPDVAGHLGAVHSILVPIDFSDHSRVALVHAKEFAALLGAKLHLLHVVEDQPYPIVYGPAVRPLLELMPDLALRMRDKLIAWFDETPGPDVAATFEATVGLPEEAITEYAKGYGAGLIVMATHGLTGLKHFFLGSVAERVVQRAPCPVFTMKAWQQTLLSEPVRPDVAVVDP